MQEPFYKTEREMYADTLEELAKGSPSVRIDDFPELDKMIGGFRPNEFTIFCGGTGVGKTTMMASLSASMKKQNVNQFVASVETGPFDYLKRVMSSMYGENLNHGDVIPLEKIALVDKQLRESFKDETFYLSLYEDRFSVETLIEDIAYFVEEKKVQVVIVDNLNFFMKPTSAQNQVVEMDRIIHDLIMFCKQTPVHLIMVCHPKKTMNGRVESEFDIKGSSTAVQEAHNVFLFNRPHPDLLMGPGTDHPICHPTDREIFIAKVRRRGAYVGKRLILKNINGVRYEERFTV